MLPGASMKKASWIILTVLGVAITLISLVSASMSAASRAQRDEAHFRTRLFSSQSEFPCRERARALDLPRSHHKDVARVRAQSGAAAAALAKRLMSRLV